MQKNLELLPTDDIDISKAYTSVDDIEKGLMVYMLPIIIQIRFI